MGLPQNLDQQPSPSIPTRSEPSASNVATELPPAAIDLATKLFDFARQGNTASLSQYLGAGIPVNLTNHKGDTLLMLAAYHGHRETVAMLLERGAAVDALNERGQSIIAGAVFKGYDEVVRLMVDAGADLHAGQPNAVDSAIMFQRAECLRMFGVEDGS